MNKSTLKITIIALILTASFNASATGGGKKPDPSINRVQCWYSAFAGLLPARLRSYCLIGNNVKQHF